MTWEFREGDTFNFGDDHTKRTVGYHHGRLGTFQGDHYFCYFLDEFGSSGGTWGDWYCKHGTNFQRARRDLADVPVGELQAEIDRRSAKFQYRILSPGGGTGQWHDMRGFDPGLLKVCKRNLTSSDSLITIRQGKTTIEYRLKVQDAEATNP